MDPEPHTVSCRYDEIAQRIVVMCTCGVADSFEVVGDAWTYADTMASVERAMEDAHLDQDLRRLTA
jgi:hypothetical protein